MKLSRKHWHNLFLAVADWNDGVPTHQARPHIMKAYLAIFRTPEGRKIYSDAVDAGPKKWGLK